jgi:hypothetical protein
MTRGWTEDCWVSAARCTAMLSLLVLVDGRVGSSTLTRQAMGSNGPGPRPRP